MTNRLGLRSWAAGALVLVVVSACGSTEADPPRPTASSPSTTSPSTSASPTESEAASAAASEVVHAYFATIDALRQDPQRPLNELAKVATSGELIAERRLIEQERGKGLRQVGATGISQLKVQSVNLDNTDPQAGRVPTVVVDVCWDVSGADLIDRSGNSVVSPDRADTGWTRLSVANYHWKSNKSGGWRIASGQDLEQAPCAAS